MILIAAVDDHNGMMFHDRRQSQDRLLRERIIGLVGEDRLWMNAYSAKQFTEEVPHLEIDDDFLRKAAAGDYCFCENCLPQADRIEKIYLFHWNRVYPADFYFTIDLTGYNAAAEEDFKGYSHDKISMEVYERR